MCVMLEHALSYYPNSVEVHAWLIKIYSKLGMVSLVKALADRFPTVPRSVYFNEEKSDPTATEEQPELKQTKTFREGIMTKKAAIKVLFDKNSKQKPKENKFTAVNLEEPNPERTQVD